MKINLPTQINLNDVGALSRRLAKTRRIGASKFYLELSERDCKNAIWAAFRAEVEGMGREATPDPVTLQYITDIALWLLDPHGKPGLLLQGTLGTGKTMLALGLCNLIKFLTSQSERAADAVTPVFVKAKKVCEQFVRYPDDYELLRNVRILAIDDLGEEPKDVMQYGMVYTPLLDILEERYDRQRCTIITTNLTQGEIAKHYGQRLADRFHDMFHRVLFTGPSRR